MRTKGLRVIKMAIQVIALFGISEIGDLIAKFTHIPIPGSLIGLVLLFIALQLRIVKLQWLTLGGDWLIAEMLIFFIPSAVGMTMFGPLLLRQGLQIFLIIFCSTSLVMLSTGLIAEGLTRHRQRRQPDQREFSR